EMPEDQRLSDEPDAQAIEATRLRTALAEYENRLPRLRVVFGSRKDHHRFTLPPAVGAAPEQIAARVDELKRKHPAYQGLKHLPPGFGTALHHIPNDEIRRYNDALPKFFADMEKFFV